MSARILMKALGYSAGAMFAVFAVWFIISFWIGFFR